MSSTGTASGQADALRLRLRARRDFRLLGRWLGSGPVSTTLAVLMLVVFLASIPFDRARLEDYVTAGLGHPWWTFIVSTVWVTDGLHLLVDTALLLTVGIYLERAIGSRWFIIIGFTSSLIGSLAAVAASHGISAVDQPWAQLLETQDIAGSSVLLVGVAMAASVKLGPLMRRRTRVTVGTILLVMLGFAGTLDTLAAFGSALTGLVFGLLLWRQHAELGRVQGTPREGRILVSLVVAGVVVGVLISLSSPQAMGALTSLRYQFVSNDLSAGTIAELCTIDGLEGQCAHYTYLLRSAGWGSKILVVMPLVLQLVMAWGLRGGRRSAMWGTIALQGLTALIALVHLVTVWLLVRGWSQAAALMGFSESGAPTARFVVPIVVPLVLILIVSVTSRLFTVRAAEGAYRRFWTSLAWWTAGALAVSVVLGVVFRGWMSVGRAAFLMVSDFFIRLLPSSMLSLVSPQAIIENRAMMLILEWTPTVPWVAACFLLWRSFASRALPNAVSRSEYMRIVKHTDAGTLGWIGTWQGNRYWGSQTYRAAIAYRAYGGVALTVSDPAASPDDLADVVREFTDFCVDQDLTPAFYSVHSAVAEVTEGWGWPRMRVGEETVLPLEGLEFKGKRFQDIRTATNHAAKEGIRTEWNTWAGCSEPIRRQIRALSDQWVSEKALPEMGFTLGGVAELDDPDVRILMALDEHGTVQGVTSWMPVFCEGRIIGWTLDFMRRLEDGFRPVMEFLIAQAALWAKEQGCELISLSGVPLAHAENAPAGGGAAAKGQDERGDAGGASVEVTSGAPGDRAPDVASPGTSTAALDAILDLVGRALEPVYGFRSLLRFKKKFHPVYDPLYLTVPDVTALPAAGLAISHAYAPGMSALDVARVAQMIRRK